VRGQGRCGEGSFGETRAWYPLQLYPTRSRRAWIFAAVGAIVALVRVLQALPKQVDADE